MLTSGIPYVSLISANPLICYREDAPPECSGLSLKNSTREEWARYREALFEAIREVDEEYNVWLEENGAPRNKRTYPHVNHSPYLNLYQFPEELDYTEFSPPEGN